MRFRLLGALVFLRAAGACTDGSDDDIGDGDADADGDGAPVCAASNWVSAHAGRGDPDDVLDGAHELFVVASSQELLQVERDLHCDPADDVSLTIESRGWADDAWLPPAGSSLLVRYWEQWDGSYAELRSPDGALVWEGGAIREDDDVERRFHIVDVPSEDECVLEELPDCVAETRLRATVQTDEGEVELGSGESRVVTVDGEPYVAVLALVARRRLLVETCLTDGGGGAFGSVYLARTTAADLPHTDPEVPSDECPETIPSEGEACTTRGDVRCDYTYDGGCEVGLVCRGCSWRVETRGEPEGVDCGI